MHPKTANWLRAAAIFLGVLAAGAWPSNAMSHSWSRVMSHITNPFLQSPWLADRAHAALSPAPETIARAGADAISADTRLSIRVEDIPSEAEFGLTLRRDSYLPLLIFLAAILATPTRLRTRLSCLAIGVPIIALVAIASVYALVAYVLLHELPQLFSDLAAWRGVLDFVFERWLSPPANRVIAPLLLAAGLLLARSRRDTEPAPSSSSA
jgi:hypothetical protein